MLPSQALLGLRYGVLPKIEVLVRSWLNVRARKEGRKISGAVVTKLCACDFAVCSALSVRTICCSPVNVQRPAVSMCQSQDEYGANNVKE